MIKALIFDFFDVFRTDAYKAWLHANTIPHEGEYFDASHQQDIGAITNEEFLERLSKLRGRPVTRQELDANARVDEEVVNIAKLLRGRYRIALLSNSPSLFIRKLLVEHDLAQYFDEIVISSEVGMTKPGAGIFRYTLEQLGVEPSEAVFIDDNAGHVQAAEELGIKGIQFTSAGQLKAELAKAGVSVGP